jgi:predicted ATPase
VEYPESVSDAPLSYMLGFTQVAQRLEVVDEIVSLPIDKTDAENSRPDHFYVHQGENFLLYPRTSRDEVPGSSANREGTLVDRTKFRFDQSILSQRRDPDHYPELTYLASEFEAIKLYRDWDFGRRNAARLPVGVDLPADFLLPDASNLTLVLHDLMQRSVTRNKLLTYLRRFYDAAEFISTTFHGGTAQLSVEESNGGLIPATRLSDGTLRYLSLLAILCHPSPPPLICIEEPELGLHPDIVPTIAELLKEASQRTQLIVTTHSEALVSALSDVPESVVVCDSGPDGTTLRRLNRDDLATWLENYSLGEIWQRGEIGGTRW